MPIGAPEQGGGPAHVCGESMSALPRGEWRHLPPLPCADLSARLPELSSRGWASDHRWLIMTPALACGPRVPTLDDCTLCPDGVELWSFRGCRCEERKTIEKVPGRAWPHERGEVPNAQPQRASPDAGDPGMATPEHGGLARPLGGTWNMRSLEPGCGPRANAKSVDTTAQYVIASLARPPAATKNAC